MAPASCWWLAISLVQVVLRVLASIFVFLASTRHVASSVLVLVKNLIMFKPVFL